MIQKGKKLEWIIDDKQDNEWLFSVLKNTIQASKPVMQYWMNQHKLKVNHKPVVQNVRLKKGDRLYVDLQEEEQSNVKPEYGEIDILFEDDHMVIVNKPAGMATHPNEKGQTGTLANFLAFHFQMNGEEQVVRHVHRLDFDTTGAVVFAKHRLAHAILDRQLQLKELKRTYVAIAEGRLKRATGVINKPIGRDRFHPTKRRVSPTGQEAITNYQVKGHHQGADLSLVELELETGRTHQIRVHMESIGHSLTGDLLYGGSASFLNRQALHAAKICVTHPITGESIHIIAPFPDDLLKLTTRFFPKFFPHK